MLRFAFFIFTFFSLGDLFAQDTIPNDIVVKHTIILKNDYAVDDETAPVNIGGFRIGQTTRHQINQLLATLNEPPIANYVYQGFNDFATFQESKNLKEPASSDYNFEIAATADDSNEVRLSITSFENHRSYFINQVKIGEYYINNILLSFLRDTLIEFSYHADNDLLGVIGEKYSRQGVLLSKEKKYVPCVKKSYEALTYGFRSKDSTKLAIVYSEINADKYCRSTSYMQVIAYDTKKFDEKKQIVAAALAKRKRDKKIAAEKERVKTLNQF